MKDARAGFKTQSATAGNCNLYIDGVPCVYKIACCSHMTLIFFWQKQAVLFHTACLTLEISVYKIFKLYFSVYYDGQNAAEEWGMFCPAVCARIPTGKMSQGTSSIICLFYTSFTNLHLHPCHYRMQSSCSNQQQEHLSSFPTRLNRLFLPL